MELRSSQLATITTSIPSGNWREKLLFTNSTNNSVKLPDYRKSSSYTGSRKLKFIGSGFSASGTTRFSSLAVKATVAESKTKDDNLVYVAGATGKVGSRTVRELLKLGFNVRAGVRSAQRAESLVQSVKQMKSDADTSSEGPKPIEKLELVECDLEKPEQIKPALGNASIIICCIGASEKEISDITGPYRIDYQATKNLIDAATAAKVNHFILLTSLGTNKVGFPAAILNLFWGVLIWKRKAEEALLASGLPYTIVRPGGMERPTDAYKETHNMTLSEEDTLFGGQVSNLQVAELLAYMATNRSVSYCKVVEVIAETTAPLTPMEDLLAKIPSQRIEVKPLKKEDAAEKPQPTPPTTAISEPPAPTPPVEEEPTEEKTKATPLSPYTMYEDLKPPVSPIPLPPSKAVSMNEVPSSNQVSNILETPSPGTPVETEIALPEVVKSRPLSPYTAYEDLKPPVSPTPLSPSESVSINEIPSSKQTDNILETPSTPVETEFTLPEVVKSRPLSPFAAYEDLKPPSSPSPIANGPKELTPEVVPVITGGNGVANVASNSNEQDPPLVVNYRLSPYVAYEDLKPPTSPSPVPNK